MLHIQMHNISSYSNFNKYLMLRMIPQQDWDTYVGLCDENATCIEPELNGNITAGLKFHKVSVCAESAFEGCIGLRTLALPHNLTRFNPDPNVKP